MDSKSEPSDTVLVGRLQCKTDFYFRQKFNLNSVNYGRMEEQRCFLQPSRKAEAEAFFKIITSSQSRLDDQRAVLPTLPGISGNSEGKEISRHTKAEIPTGNTPQELQFWRCSDPVV
uniref:Uncharacterized protein n=1 Tax=Amphilophus citrinellus TaxID=61819 RepID=A0A3Q0SDX2_AMPCI